MHEPSVVAPSLSVTVATWPNDAEAPACLMVDDLTDGWIDRDGQGEATGGNDWGHALDRPGSSFAHLRDGILREFPEVKTTFFVPVARLPDVWPAAHRCHFRPIDERPDFGRFLRDVASDERFECAYHGREHGRPGPLPRDYVAEFAGYTSVDDAVSGIEAGRRIWEKVFRESPTGGKYPAYDPGRHGDDAIDRAGFAWWCRQWDRGDAADDAVAPFRPRCFGKGGVVDVPSSLHGGLVTPVPGTWRSPRRIVGAARTYLRSARALRTQLSSLLAGRCVLTIQEHITSSRPDDDPQTPNLYDDTPTLRRILTVLRSHRIWHARCGEIAGYFATRRSTSLAIEPGPHLRVSWTGSRCARVPISLVFEGASLPDRFPLRGARGDVELRVSRRDGGERWVSAPVSLEAGEYRLALPDGEARRG